MPMVVLLTDDVANRQKAEMEGLRCASSKSVVWLFKLFLKELRGDAV